MRDDVYVQLCVAKCIAHYFDPLKYCQYTLHVDLRRKQAKQARSLFMTVMVLYLNKVPS